MSLTEIYNLSRFSGLNHQVLEVPESFFTGDIDEDTMASMFHTTFWLDTSENVDYTLLYRSLLTKNNQGHMIISIKCPDGITKNYFISIQFKDEGYEVPCCKDLYAFDLSDELALLKYQITNAGKTGDEFCVSLLSFSNFSAEVYNNNKFMQVSKVIVPSNTEPRYGSYIYNIPYAVYGSDLWTGVGLRNNDTSFADIVVVIYDKDGRLVAHSGSMMPSISAKGHQSFLTTQVPGALNKEFEGWMQIKSSLPLSGQVFFIGEEGYMSGMPICPDMSKEVPSKTSYLIPHVAQTAEWDTIIAVCNPNNKEITIPIKFFDEIGQIVYSESYMLQALSSKKYSVSDMMEEFTGSIEINYPGEIAVFALFSNLKSGGKCYSGAVAVR
ncbi:hypothetical protein [Desulfonema limicola]|uniref:hypothetical protein n=1 Tax=Desulfonema limicola TaxID=45656 RepID=UPI001A9BB460|nr:hypothetical protein [Desulfonema limicola]